MATYELGNTTGLKKKLACTGVALILTGSLASCGNEKATTSCESPRAISPFFAADPSATEDRTTWKNAIAVRTEIPVESDGVVVGYRDQNASAWKDSMPISPDRAQTIALLLGNGAVSFSVQTIAAKGSAACANKPVVTFSEPQPMQPLIVADATLPQW